MRVWLAARVRTLPTRFPCALEQSSAHPGSPLHRIWRLRSSTYPGGLNKHGKHESEWNGLYCQLVFWPENTAPHWYLADQNCLSPTRFVWPSQTKFIRGVACDIASNYCACRQGSTKAKLLARCSGDLHFSSTCLKLFWTSPKPFSKRSNEPWKFATTLSRWASDRWNRSGQCPIAKGTALLNMTQEIVLAGKVITNEHFETPEPCSVGCN